MTELVVGTPAWNMAWVLPLWMASVRANVDPAKTGLVFVVPPTDTATREAIVDLTAGFSWVEVIRDRGAQLSAGEGPADHHRALAVARNQILRHVIGVRPQHFIAWDADFLVPPGTVDMLLDDRLPVMTVWGWLNRQSPREVEWVGTDGKPTQVLWQEPMAGTAMRWDPRNPGRALHYPAGEWDRCQTGTWPCGVTLAFTLMNQRAYSVASYRPHEDGEAIPFNWQLETRDVPRFCNGDITGVHLYDPGRTDEIELGWPRVMRLADEKPLAATFRGERPVEWEAFGLFPKEKDHDRIAA